MKRKPKIVGGEMGSPFAITVIARVQRLVKPKPKNPQKIANKHRTGRLLAKPYRRKADREAPMQDMKTTILRGHRSLK
jgi:hypothetical protein